MREANSPATGFTLVELMITLVLLGVLIMLAMPTFSAWIQNTRIRTTAESIVNGMQVARSEAVRRNSPVQFVMGVGSSWAVSCVATTPGCPDTNPIQMRATGEGSTASIIVTPSDGLTVVFDSFGTMTTPVPGGGGASVRFDVDVDTAVLAASESRELRVTVDTGGNIRMCDPNTIAPDPRAC
jgi:type IV fimbrial biogenesis protein FimT